MKKQAGFTLIELLLVLAIIGIISSIAIPSLLSQRARARDKASIENLAGSLGDLVGQFDKMREAGVTTANIPTSMGAYMTANHSKDKNPWSTSGQAAFATAISTIGGSTQSAFSGNMAASIMGQVKFFIKIPSASGTVGFVGGAVKIKNSINGSTTYRKVTAIE